MEISYTKSFEKDYCQLPGQIQKRLDKQLQFLLNNFHHPSLNIKKMKGHPSIWEGRINSGYRFTFQVIGNTCLIRRAGTHDILRNP